jgi:hypothetical protein
MWPVDEAEAAAAEAERIGDMRELPDEALVAAAQSDPAEPAPVALDEPDPADSFEDDPDLADDAPAAGETVELTVDEIVEATPPAAQKLSKLTVWELQVRYAEVVGRSTGSSNKSYLIWKIQQAQKGKVPVGPRQQRQASNGGSTSQNFKVLPLRMETSLVAQLDEAWERLGMKSRTELIRRALCAYLATCGESEIAEQITVQG